MKSVLNWTVGIIILPFLILLLWVSLLYPFYWMVLFSNDWNQIFYVLFWLTIGWIVVAGTTVFSGFFIGFCTKIVGKQTTYSWILAIGIVILVIYSLYASWSRSNDLLWEGYEYNTFNKVIFTIMSLQVLKIPWTIVRVNSGKLEK